MISGTALEVLMTAIKQIEDSNEQKKLVDAFIRAKGFVLYRSSPM
jgi:hypothetical protein